MNLRIALLHLSPVVGEFDRNRRLIEAAVHSAVEHGAEWIVTPELCVSGYEFAPRFGSDWIAPRPDAWVSKLCGFMAGLGVILFLGHAEKDFSTGKLHNAAFAIGPDGEILGAHRKRTVIPGIEAWATAGGAASPIHISKSNLKVGILICADAYTRDMADELKKQGAEILISPAAWTPKPHGPETSWEDRSRETGLPLFVCNRTGADHSMDFSPAESCVAVDGKRVVVFSAPESSVVLVDYDVEKREALQSQSFPLRLPPDPR